MKLPIFAFVLLYSFIPSYAVDNAFDFIRRFSDPSFYAPDFANVFNTQALIPDFSQFVPDIQTTDLSKLPDNYNKVNHDIKIIDGKEVEVKEAINKVKDENGFSFVHSQSYVYPPGSGSVSLPLTRSIRKRRLVKPLPLKENRYFTDEDGNQSSKQMSTTATTSISQSLHGDTKVNYINDLKNDPQAKIFDKNKVKEDREKTLAGYHLPIHDDSDNRINSPSKTTQENDNLSELTKKPFHNSGSSTSFCQREMPYKVQLLIFLIFLIIKSIVI